MPILSSSLERTLRHACMLAEARDDHLADLQHLLLALMDDPAAVEALATGGVDLPTLRSGALDLVVNYQSVELDRPARLEPGGVKQVTTAVQRIVQHAASAAVADGMDEIDGALLLVAFHNRPEGPVALLLTELGATAAALRDRRHG